MAKSNRGGKRTAGGQTTFRGQVTTPPPTPTNTPLPQPTPTPVTPPTPQQVAAGVTLPTGGVPFSQFQNMTDDQKANVINQALGVSVPVFLDDTPAQQLVYYTGMNSKPTVVTESQLNHTAGKSLWRSVHDTYNRQTDIGYTGKQIYNQLATGDFTMYSDSGGSAYGRAIYFDIHKGSYGSGSKYTIMHAKLKPNAVVWSDTKVNTAVQNEIRSGSKLGQALQQVRQRDSASVYTVYCLAKGIDAYESGGYHMIVNRGALYLSDTTF